MKKLLVTLALIATLCSANFGSAAERYVTLQKNTDGAVPITLAIAADEVAFLIGGWKSDGGQLDQTIDVIREGTTFTELNFAVAQNQSLRAPMIPVCGPCTISMYPQNVAAQSSRVFVTIKILPNPNIMGLSSRITSLPVFPAPRQACSRTDAATIFWTCIKITKALRDFHGEGGSY